MTSSVDTAQSFNPPFPPRLDDPVPFHFSEVGGVHSEAEEEEEDCYYGDDDGDELGHVEDADWDLRTGDFTKAFNRARQADAALRRPASSSTSTPARAGRANGRAAAQAPLPAMNITHRRPDAQTQLTGEHKQLAELSDRLASLASGDGKLERRYDVSQSVGGQLGRSAVPRKAGDGFASSGTRRKDKSDRATHQAVFDPRTLLIIYKLIQSGLLGEVHGVVSTGKEANVYHAYEGPRDQEGKPVPVPVYGGAPLGGTMHRDQGDGVEPPKGLALKVYKTAQLSFKDRGIYTKGDTRFEHGYQGNNSRKMVSQWASKEDRNLRRLLAAGLRAPKVVEHKDNVLVMDFLGNPQGWASPRLRDAEALIDQEDEARHSTQEDDLAPSRWIELYAELLAVVRIMYQQCRLVHADLSEYNILYHENHLWIIDVSQSVQHDHESAFDFLRHDLEHVDRYFARHTVPVLGLRKTFDFVISEPAQPVRRRKGGGQAGLAQHMGGDQTHEEALLDSVVGDGKGPPIASSKASPVTSHGGGETEPELMRTILDLVRQKQLRAVEKAQTKASAPSKSTLAPVSTQSSPEAPSTDHCQPDEEDADVEDAVFKATYLPRTLEDVYDAERDADLVQAGQTDQLVYAKITGLDVTARKQVEVREESGAEAVPVDGHDESENDSESSDESEEDEGELHAPKQPRGHRHEDRDAKRERKQAIKEEKREKRKIKMPKKDKKAKVKKTAGTKR